MFTVVDNVSYDKMYLLRSEALSIDESGWDRYDNPFEHKRVLPKPYNEYIGSLVNTFSEMMLGWARGAFPHHDLQEDVDNHFTALFVYEKGDFLKLHLDADIHPTTKKQKSVTALMYLSTDDVLGGALEMWSGSRYEPKTPVAKIMPKFGTMVLFANGYTAWHGNPDPVYKGARIVLTFSYLSPMSGVGLRERAFFAPQPGEVWTPEVIALRNQRANAQDYAKVYRVDAGAR